MVPPDTTYKCIFLFVDILIKVKAVVLFGIENDAWIPIMVNENGTQNQNNTHTITNQKNNGVKEELGQAVNSWMIET